MSAKEQIKAFTYKVKPLLIKEIREMLEGLYGLHTDGHFEDIDSLPELQRNDDMLKTRHLLEEQVQKEKSAGGEGHYVVEKMVKETAFTHLNRLVALKMLEVRNLIRQTLSRGVDSNAFKFYLVDHPADKQRWERGEADQAYRNFLLWQCSQMPAAVKVLFDPEDLHSRIFPRPQILHQVLAYINEEQMNGAWKEDEAIGWLYQFFIEEDKKAVFDKIYSQKKKMGLRDIPVATQLFTPRWIVRYLVENTLGRLWLRMYPNSRLRDKMEYYVPNPVNDDELLPLRPVREITLLDPACGTMHFGVVAFDLFYEMYLEEIERAGEEGWPQTASASSEAEIPSLILSQNLYGIDLDLRAVQLSALALLIKAMTKNPQVKLERINLVCTDITPFDSRTKQSFLGQLQLKHQIARQLLDELLPYLDKAYYLGSLLKIEQVLHEFIARGREKMNYGGGPLIEYAKETGKLDDGGDAFWDEVKEEILEALEKASRDRLNGNAYVAGKSIWGMGLVDALMKKYDVVVCNPPYSGRRNMDANLSKELKEYYPKKDGDLYSTFIDRCLDLVAPRTGFCGMVTIHSFMFTSSYEEIRKKIINGSEIISILHLGTKTEFDLSNPNAQGFVAFVSGKCTHIKHSNYKESIYFRIIKDVGQKKMTSFERALQDWKRNLGNHQDKNIFILKQRDLKAIPGWPFVYWISDSIRDMFINNKLLANRAKACQGLATADNFRFLRLWWELTPDKIGYNCSDAEDAESTNKAWFPYMKGGDYQRWYGNQDFIINWDQNGREIKNFYKNGKLASRPQNMDYYFKEGATYSFLTVSNLSVRYLPMGFIFDVIGSSIFPENTNLFLLLGILNSKMSSYLIKALNPTAAYQVGDIARIPFPNLDASPELVLEIEKKAKTCIHLKRMQVQKEETSWEFVAPPAWSDGIYSSLALEKELALLETEINEAVYHLYDLSAEDIAQIEEEFGGLPGHLEEVPKERWAEQKERLETIEHYYCHKHVPAEVFQQDTEEDDDGGESSGNRRRQSRYLTFEEVCLASGFHPVTVYQYITENQLERQEERFQLALKWASYALGIVMGRYKPGEHGSLGSGVTSIDDFITGSLDIDENEYDSLMQHRKEAYRDGDGRRHIFAKTVEASKHDQVDEDGILVLDPEQKDDVATRTGELLELMLGERQAAEVLEALGGDLHRFWERDFFSKYHIPTYRKRPIYWLLQSPRKSYGVYLYHERIDGDTLFKVQRSYLDPKLNRLSNQLKELQFQADKMQGSEKRKLEREIERLEDIRQDVADFNALLGEITEKGYIPDLNDGVLINMAPLYKVMPSWAAEPRKCWGRLEKGEYDWAHIAFHFWPDRVREKCRHDRSLALAHNLDGQE